MNLKRESILYFSYQNHRNITECNYFYRCVNSILFKAPKMSSRIEKQIIEEKNSSISLSAY